MDIDEGESDATPAAVITACEDGPLLVRGDFALRTVDGANIDTRRGTVALCRCGKSAIRPFCDGTHKMIGFLAPSRREGC
jgi:CDGSH-type Zn-finger protein